MLLPAALASFAKVLPLHQPGADADGLVDPRGTGLHDIWGYEQHQDRGMAQPSASCPFVAAFIFGDQAFKRFGGALTSNHRIDDDALTRSHATGEVDSGG